MPNLNQLLCRHRELGTENSLNDLLAAVTRYARAAAAKAGSPEPHDTAQRVVVKVWRCLDCISGSLPAYISSAVRNMARDDHRKVSGQQEMEDLNDLDIVVEEPPCQPARNPLTLSDRRVQTAAALLIVGHTVTETAAALSVSPRHLRRMCAA